MALAVAPGPAAAQQVDVEVIRERYPNRSVKIEREVTTDAEGNYVNQGAWRMWDPAGRLVAEGRYDMGRRNGLWTRWLERDDSTTLGDYPFSEFAAPFVSQATFVTGRLDGAWVIFDAQAREVSRISFHRGKRDDRATLFLPGGQIHREAAFRRGVPVGDVVERTPEGELAIVATYVDGHQLVNKVTFFPGIEDKENAADYLAATTIETAPDDFWHCHFAEYESQGEDVRHGEWQSWYTNGQLQVAGNFQYDREIGTFTWWHANGQVAVEGQFVDGQQDGQWTWWHANGQKAANGTYHYGSQIGQWRRWAEDGRLMERTAPEGNRVSTLPR